MAGEKDGWRNERLEVAGKIYSLESCIDTEKIPYQQRVDLATELTPLTGKGFKRFDLHSDELSLDVSNHVVTAPRLTVIRNEASEAVAFVASALIEIDGTSFFHLGGIIVDPTLHHSGFGLRILTRELVETEAKAIVLRTQSMKMLGLTKKVAVIDEALTLTVAPIVYPFNLDGVVNHRVYRDGHSLYEDEESFAPEAISWINWREGDALVIAGWIKTTHLTL